MLFDRTDSKYSFSGQEEFTMKVPKALTIAGSDTSGGAGLQADIKTFQEFGVYGMTAITVLVAQNPANNWAHDVYPLSLEALEAQINTVLGGIGVDAMKTGMLGTVEIISLVARKLDEYPVKNIVIDPVMVCKGTDEVLHPESAVAISEQLAPRATVITPNVFEASQLSGIRIQSVETMKEAAVKIHALGPKYVLIKAVRNWERIRPSICCMTAKNSPPMKHRKSKPNIRMARAAPTPPP